MNDSRTLMRFLTSEGKPQPHTRVVNWTYVVTRSEIFRHAAKTREIYQLGGEDLMGRLAKE
jgi:hypothetical protein